MRRMAVVTAMPALGLALVVSCFAPAKARAQDARPEFSIDQMRLPPLLLVQPKAERDQQSLLAAGVGAVAGIVVVDVVTGGLALAPLGLPTFASLTAAPVAAGAAAPAPVTYTLVQQVLAGVTTMVATLGGGYIGMLVAGPVATP
jgi:hypothetical protein